MLQILKDVLGLDYILVCPKTDALRQIDIGHNHRAKEYFVTNSAFCSSDKLFPKERGQNEPFLS